MSDLISRQAAIDAITDENIIRNMDSVMDSKMHRVKRSVHRIIASLPSAQPEYLTETEIIICKMFLEEFGHEGCNEYQILMDLLDGKRIAQPEIVRCKDCFKHHESGLCEGWSRYGTITTRDDGWCAWAERRTDGSG